MIRKQIEELTRSTFEEITRIENEYRQAEQRRKETPQRTGFVDAGYAAKAARAEADYLAARDSYNSMKRDLPGKSREKLAAIRREYAQEVAQRYAVDPSKLDMGMLELLKSGIMKPGEYSSMMEEAQKAGNTTMTRLIARYASEAAEAVERKYGDGSPQARELRAVGYSGNIDPGAAALEAFDGVAEIFNRCIGNPSMIPMWGELAEPLLEML